jgi:hypothetical protein
VLYVNFAVCGDTPDIFHRQALLARSALLPLGAFVCFYMSIKFPWTNSHNRTNIFNEADIYRRSELPSVHATESQSGAIHDELNFTQQTAVDRLKTAFWCLVNANKHYDDN